MDVVAIIPARIGSKGVPQKNLRPFLGKPLFLYSVEQAKGSIVVSTVVVSSDSEDICRLAEENDVTGLARPPELAMDETPLEPVLLHTLDELGIREGVAVVLQPTSPIRHPVDITNAVRAITEYRKDSVFSAVRTPHTFLWQQEKEGSWDASYNFRARLNRQAIAPTYIENGSIYAFDIAGFLREKVRLFGKIGVYEMGYWNQFQIDQEEDWVLCEWIMATKPWKLVEARNGG